MNELVTVGVLGGAYRGGRRSLRALLTHLSDGGGDPAFASCAKPGHLADLYSAPEAERYARPTCPRCAKAWDKIHRTAP